MSLFGSAILERLHADSPVTKPDNPFYKVFDNTVGEWLDHFDVDQLHEELFVNMATGKWLDLHGEQYGVARHVDETDEDYRRRVIQHTLGKLTPVLLGGDFGLEVYTDVDDFDISNNVLVSDNYFIKNNGYIVFSDWETQRLVEQSHIINEAVRWFVL